MKRICNFGLILFLCFGVVGCSSGSSNKFSKYEWGETLQKKLDALGIDNISNVVNKTLEYIESSVSVSFLADGIEVKANIRNEKEKWIVDYIYAPKDHDDVFDKNKYYYYVFDTEDLYDFKTGNIIRFAREK